MLILPVSGEAQTVYVSDEFEITLRTGPGNDHKIISMPKSGNAMEILQKGEEWSRVRLPDGKEGWVLSRYISPTRPAPWCWSGSGKTTRRWPQGTRS